MTTCKVRTEKSVLMRPCGEVLSVLSSALRHFSVRVSSLLFHVYPFSSGLFGSLLLNMLFSPVVSFFLLRTHVITFVLSRIFLFSSSLELLLCVSCFLTCYRCPVASAAQTETPLVRRTGLLGGSRGEWSRVLSDQVTAVLEDQAERGQVLKLTEQEARNKYPHLVIASLGANRKDKCLSKSPIRWVERCTR